MKTKQIIAAAVLIVASGLALYVARAQQPGVTRTELQRHDLAVPAALPAARSDRPAAALLPKRHTLEGDALPGLVRPGLHLEVGQNETQPPPPHALGYTVELELGCYGNARLQASSSGLLPTPSLRTQGCPLHSILIALLVIGKRGIVLEGDVRSGRAGILEPQPAGQAAARVVACLEQDIDRRQSLQ